MAVEGTTDTGPELLVELRRERGAAARPARGRRCARRSAGAAGPGARLPSSRALARDLGVSRRLVVDAYAQLAAEGYRRAAGRRARSWPPGPPGGAGAPASAPRPGGARASTSSPASPDLAVFPRAAWLRAPREVLRDAPDRGLDYPDSAAPRRCAARWPAHLRRVRGVAPTPSASSSRAAPRRRSRCSAASLAGGRARGSPSRTRACRRHRLVLARRGARGRARPRRRRGTRVDALARTGADGGRRHPRAPVPARRGAVARSAGRRSLGWARAGGLVVEDDYDAEFRYDRAPVGALQGLAPERVAYLGTASKTLAPGLRLGWLVLPAGLVERRRPPQGARRRRRAGARAARPRAAARQRPPTTATCACAPALPAPPRRARGRARRASAGRAPEGVAAGLHAIVRLPRAVPADAMLAAARRRDVGAYPLALGTARNRPPRAGLREPARAGDRGGHPQPGGGAGLAGRVKLRHTDPSEHAEDEDPFRREEALQADGQGQGPGPSRLHEPHPREEVAQAQARHGAGR